MAKKKRLRKIKKFVQVDLEVEKIHGMEFLKKYFVDMKFFIKIIKLSEFFLILLRFKKHSFDFSNLFDLPFVHLFKSFHQFLILFAFNHYEMFKIISLFSFIFH